MSTGRASGMEHALAAGGCASTEGTGATSDWTPRPDVRALAAPVNQ
jgi:hypothetical protein